MKFTKMAKYWFYGLLISLCLGCAQRTAEEKTLWMVDKLEDELKRSQVFTRVEGGFDAERGLALMEAFTGIHPCLFSDADMEAVFASVSEEAVKKQVADNMRTLQSPEGMMEKNRILKDPMNYSRFALEKLSGTRMVSGVTVREGRFVDMTGKHALLVAEIAVHALQITAAGGVPDHDGAALTGAAALRG